MNSRGKYLKRHSLDFAALLLNAGLLFLLISAAVRLQSKVAPPSNFEGLIPAQTLINFVTSQAAHSIVQATSDRSFRYGAWEGNDHLLVKGSMIGDRMELVVPGHLCVGGCRLSVYFTKANDYAIVGVFANGIQIGSDIDLYYPVIIATGSIDVGIIETSSEYDAPIEFRIVGANPLAKSPFFQFGIDGIKLTRL